MRRDARLCFRGERAVSPRGGERLASHPPIPNMAESERAKSLRLDEEKLAELRRFL
jgi:hypothetical protein